MTSHRVLARYFIVKGIIDIDFSMASKALANSDVMVTGHDGGYCDMMEFAVHNGEGNNHQIDTRKWAIDPATFGPILLICICSHYVLMYGI